MIEKKLKVIEENLININISPDLEVEPNFFDENGNVKKTPTVIVKYYATESDKRETVIPLPHNMLEEKEVDDIVNYITFQIEQFQSEIDSIEFGGE